LGKAGSSPPEVEIEDDDVAVIFFTAGTTGIPKGAMLTTRGLMTVVKGHRERFYGPLGELVSIVAGLPLSHIYGLNTIAISSLFNRSPVVIEEGFNPEKTARDIEAYRVSVMFGVPNHFLRLLDYAEKFDLRSLRLIMIGGQYIPEELWQKIDKTFDCYGIEGYGLTEGTGHTISSPLGDRRPGSTGIPFGGTEIKIFDNNGNELPVGEVGEIVQKSPANMKGYLNLPEITDQTLQQGWLRTGDFGRMDEDGHVYVVGRKKELIIRGGFNVYPSEVENVLFKHPQVSEAAVFGVNDPLKGETVAAAVLPEPGENLIEEELINYCKERLARYKVPKYIDVMESPLPKSPTGKILKRHLQDEMSKKLEDKQ
jgi:long-chain acyl-CoA synthetase